MARMGLTDWLIESPPSASLRGDTTGRWQAARLAGKLYRRLLDGRVVCYETPRAAPSATDAEPVYAAVGELAARLAVALTTSSTPLRLSGPGERSRAALAGQLERCAARAAEGPALEQQRYVAAYPEPVEILPPDRYRDVVLLPATGCPSARCTFCAFYRGRTFRALDGSELLAHARAVAELFGPAMGLRSGLFLGSASALSLSQRRLVHALDVATRIFPSFERGSACFWDPDHSPRRSPAEWAELGQLSLRAAYLGLETGLSSLRQRVGKSGAIEVLIERVQQLREAMPAEWFRLGVIVMVGLGGAAAVDPHQSATVEVVRQLALAPTDLVYLSPLAGALDPPMLDAAGRRLKHALREVTKARVVPYAMERFRYFS